MAKCPDICEYYALAYMYALLRVSVEMYTCKSTVLCGIAKQKPSHP